MKIPITSFRIWLVNKNLKERTIEEYLYYFNRFVPYGLFNQKSVSMFTSKKENMNGVARAFLMNLRKFMMVNYKELGLSQENRLEISEVELPQLTGRTKQRLIKPLTQEQILELEKYLLQEKAKLQLLMSYYGGLRVGELFKIRIISFNWDEWKKDTSQVGECAVFGKGDKEGLAFFPASLMRRIATYIRSQSYSSPASYLFMSRVDDLENVRVKNKTGVWWKQLKIAGIKSGITQLDGNGNIIRDTKVHPHKLRHSWGYHLKTVMNMDIRDIQELLRHSSIGSTERYTYTDKSHLKKLLLKKVFTPSSAHTSPHPQE